jgi:ABC-type transport system involved in multi-copper enzyme maturation permease subunit
LANSGSHAVVYAGLFQGFLLRLIVYFGCVAVFSNVFRREILDQTLHYSFLAPVRREALVAGKYVAGILAAGVVFMLMTAATQVLFYAPLGSEVVNAQAVGDGLTYVGITALAVIGYGALFLTIGLFVNNPIVPAVLILSWETASFILPAFLQKLTIVHYLQQMSPVQVPDSPFAIPAVPTPVYIAVPGLILVSAALLTVAARKVRRLEVSYGVD